MLFNKNIGCISGKLRWWVFMLLGVNLGVDIGNIDVSDVGVVGNIVVFGGFGDLNLLGWLLMLLK